MKVKSSPTVAALNALRSIMPEPFGVRFWKPVTSLWFESNTVTRTFDIDTPFGTTTLSSMNPVIAPVGEQESDESKSITLVPRAAQPAAPVLAVNAARAPLSPLAQIQLLLYGSRRKA